MKVKIVLALPIILLIVLYCFYGSSQPCEKQYKFELCEVTNQEDSILLRRKSTPWKVDELNNACFKKIQDVMYRTVTDTMNPGVGIAAPQIGVNRELILVQRFDLPGEPFKYYVNPKIVKRVMENGYTYETEGCLSIPERQESVKRNKKIVISHLDIDSRKMVVESVEGFTAIIFQHEIDHLNGVLFTDYSERTL